jgi:hypothetical protein
VKADETIGCGLLKEESPRPWQMAVTT